MFLVVKHNTWSISYQTIIFTYLELHSCMLSQYAKNWESCFKTIRSLFACAFACICNIALLLGLHCVAPTLYVDDLDRCSNFERVYSQMFSLCSHFVIYKPFRKIIAISEYCPFLLFQYAFWRLSKVCSMDLIVGEMCYLSSVCITSLCKNMVRCERVISLSIAKMSDLIIADQGLLGQFSIFIVESAQAYQ